MNIYLAVITPVLIFVSTFILVSTFLSDGSPEDNLFSVLFPLIPAGVATYFIGRFGLPGEIENVDE